MGQLVEGILAITPQQLVMIAIGGILIFLGIVKEYDELVKNPITSDEDIKLYQKLLNDYIILQKNHNEIKDKYKYT